MEKSKLENQRIKIAVVEDDMQQRNMTKDILEHKGFYVETFESGLKFLAKAKIEIFDILLLDYRLGDTTGLEVLVELKKISPITIVIIITAFANIELTINAMKEGAFDLIRKPLKAGELLLRIEKTVEYLNLNREVQRLIEKIAEIEPVKEFIYHSKNMKKVVEMALKVAKSNATVLIGGDTGTGKEKIAEIIHFASNRSKSPFIKFNIAAIPDSLIESELFGAEKGAYTGADRRIIGKFEAAHRGTLFLDEIADLSLSSQVKLLRVIQEKEIIRLGSTQPIKIDVRLISATNQNIEKLVNEKKFREDLFYRLNVIKIDVPSLSERKEDIPYLTDFFIAKYAKREKKQIKGITREGLKLLINYDFPGNIRELENLIERAVVLTNSDYLDEEDIGTFILKDEMYKTDLDNFNLTLPELLQSIENKYISEALRRTGGIRVKAAKLLGITERMLRYRLEQLNDS